jgi:hypothetical protein
MVVLLLLAVSVGMLSSCGFAFWHALSFVIMLYTWMKKNKFIARRVVRAMSYAHTIIQLTIGRRNGRWKHWCHLYTFLHCTCLVSSSGITSWLSSSERFHRWWGRQQKLQAQQATVCGEKSLKNSIQCLSLHHRNGEISHRHLCGKFKATNCGTSKCLRSQCAPGDSLQRQKRNQTTTLLMIVPVSLFKCRSNLFNLMYMSSHLPCQVSIYSSLLRS